jgi:peptidoglycan-associated lipoprotein
MSFNSMIKSVAISAAILGMAGCCAHSKKIICAHYKSCAKDRFSSTGYRVKATDIAQFHSQEKPDEMEKLLLDTRQIYFDYNKDELSHPNKTILLAHVKKMLKNPKLKLHIFGHTDQRGGSKFNMALGERRAQSVAKLFAANGVAINRFVTVSFGKIKPAIVGNNDNAWSQNRRVELIYEEQW